MPRAKISEFSTTPGDNTDIDGINIAEGCAPSGINDAIRELMAQLKDFQSGAAGDNITVVGTLAAKGTSASGADLKLYEDTDNGTNYVGFIAPASIASNVQWTLPSADGSSGQALQTNGSGTLSFATLGISAGGTGQTTANAAFNALAPSQTSNAGRYLKTDGTNTSWDLLDISTADITGTLPVANGGTGITSFGTGVATALGINVGSSGAFVTNGGALGTPSSGTVTNLTGTASININGTVGATTPNTGSFTTLTTSSTVTINGGTANGVAYLNGSKVLTTGSALTFDGSQLDIPAGTAATPSLSTIADVNTGLFFPAADQIAASVGGSEAMRLTSTGLGIGTSSPSAPLQFGKSVYGAVTSEDFYRIKIQDAGGIANDVGIGQPASGAMGFNVVASTGYYQWDLGTNGTAMTLNASGNLGLGVTPSAWSSAWRAYGIAGGATLAGRSTNPDELYLSVNSYNDGAWKYIASDFATQYYQDAGTHVWRIAASGTAGNTISFTQAMTLTSDGKLLVGRTASSGSPYSLELASGSADNRIGLFSGATLTGALQVASNEIRLAGVTATTAVTFQTNSTERARITSGGNVSIGGTADRGTTVGSAALQLFNGTAPAGTLTNGVSLYSQSGDLRFMDAAGNAYQVGFRNVPRSGSAKTTSYTLATTDVGEYIEVGSGGSITIPDATFATGDVVSIFNNTTGNITITCSITTAYIAGVDSDRASVTLATRGVATLLFISGTVCVISGNVS